MVPLDVPVVLFMFKRREATLRVLERIREAAPLRLYLLSDEGRNDAERKLVREVRLSVEASIDWDCEVVKNYASKNRGVYQNIANGAQWVFEREDAAIFLEDDNVPEVTFFAFCASLLKRYEDDTRILWICGTNYLGEYTPDDGSSYVFTKHLLPCGWASWAPKFGRFYDYDLKLLDSPGLVKRVRHEYDDVRLYRQQLRSVQSERARRLAGEPYQSWDFHMAWSIRANGLYGISPARNQILNIGADEFSAHGGTSMDSEMTRRFCGMDSYPLSMPLCHPQAVLSDTKYEQIVSRIILLPRRDRIKSGVRRFLGFILRLPVDMSVTTRLRALVDGKRSA